MSRAWVRVAAGSTGVCLASWLGLAAAAGNAGLQRSISSGAGSLFEQPTTIATVAVVSFAVALVVSKLLRLGVLGLVVGVLIGDVLAGLVLAPVAVGELEPIHAPIVFAALSVLGVQPVSAALGAWFARPSRVRFVNAE